MHLLIHKLKAKFCVWSVCACATSTFFLAWLYPAHGIQYDRYWWAKCDNIEVSFNFEARKAFISLVGVDGGTMVVAEGVFVRVEPDYAVADFFADSSGGWLIGVNKGLRGRPVIYAHFRGQSNDVCYPNLSVRE